MYRLFCFQNLVFVSLRIFIVFFDFFKNLSKLVRLKFFFHCYNNVSLKQKNESISFYTMKKLTKYFKKRVNAIISLLEIPKNSYTPETFHQLRVEIKQLNAFFELINFCSKDFKRKQTFKPFKVIFKQAGKIRELQIEESMLKKYFSNSSLTDYRTSLNANCLKEQDDFFSLIKKKLIKKLNKSYDKTTPLFKKIKKEDVNSYLEKKAKQLKRLLRQEKLEIAEIHELRKRLKTFRYNQKIIQSSPQEDKAYQKKDILSELLGKWHDYQVTVSHLKSTIALPEINPTEMRYHI